MMPGTAKKIFILGDVHFPFVNKNSLQRVYETIAILKPNIVIQIGDLYDLYSYAKFPRSLDVYTPRMEIEKAREMAEKMWEKIQKIVPNAKCYQLLGNHDIRPYKRILERFPEIERLVSFKQFFEFKGVSTLHDSRAELKIDGISFIHGYLLGLGKHCLEKRRPVVCGHSHLGGVYFHNLDNRIIFELNVGYIGDPNSVAMNYTPQRTTKWTQGVGFIDELGPRFIPFD